MKNCTLLTLLFLFTGFSAMSQVFSLLKDINESPQSFLTGSNPGEMVIMNGILFFTATTTNAGTELWESDGTSEGTTIIKDIYPGLQSSSPTNLTVVNGLIYFYALDPIHGRELWKTDGTTQGTQLIKDIFPGIESGPAGKILALNNAAFFAASDGINGRELWKSDGTDAGTVMIKDFIPGTISSTPILQLELNGWIYFSIYNPNIGPELWKSDGTAAGTVIVRTNLSAMDNFTKNGNSFYFTLQIGSYGIELWKSNGTTAGTVLVQTLNYSTPCVIKELTMVNATLFYIIDYGNRISLGKSDGLSTGTVVIRSFDLATNSTRYELTSFNNALYFKAPFDFNVNYELWKSDGTLIGTRIVKEINPSPAEASMPSQLTIMNGALYFIATTTAGTGIWKTDGTDPGTVLVKNISPISDPSLNSSTPGTIVSNNNVIFFSGTDGQTGSELWKSNGTETGTVQVKDIRPSSNNSAVDGNTQFINGPGNDIYFCADDGIHGRELWKTDGTAAGTSMVKDIRPGGGNTMQEMVLMNGIIYFAASDDVNGLELWRSDGTAAGTYMVKDINPGAPSSELFYLIASGNTLYFSATNVASGKEVWKSDGTAAGTVLVRDIVAGPNSSAPTQFTPLGTQVFFAAANNINGIELWKTDGTTAGTVMVKDINPGSAHSQPRYLTPANGIIYFNAATAAAGSELWQSDGTEAGTWQLSDIYPGAAGSNPRYLTWLSPNFYFTAIHPTSGSELWVVTARSGLANVSDINPGVSSSEPRDLKAIDNKLFFTANNGVAGNELWKLEPQVSIGMVADFWPGPGNGGGIPYGVKGKVFFSGNNGTHGEEPVRSDGTASGTFLLQDVAKSGGSSPVKFVESGKYLYAVMTDDTHGTEIWVANLDAALPLTFLDFSGRMSGSDALLNWKTANEQNTHTFEVERSTDRSAFTKIGAVAARNLPGEHSYHFTDLNIGAEAYPIIYYRLKQIDLDGNFAYSKVLALKPSAASDITLYPNPTAGRVNLRLKLRAHQNINVNIYDEAGRLVYTKQFNLMAGNHVIPLNLHHLPTNNYFLKLSGTGIDEVFELMKHAH